MKRAPAFLLKGLNREFEDKTFDALVGSQIYQFLFNRDLVLQECHRILKPGGRLVLNILSRQELCPAHNAVIKALENCNIHATNLKKLFSQNDPVTIGNFISTHGFKDISVGRLLILIFLTMVHHCISMVWSVLGPRWVGGGMPSL